MKIGLLSDSHGRTAATRAAVTILAEQGAKVLIHLGDVESSAVIDELAVLDPDTHEPLPVHLVLGNVDYDVGLLSRHARALDIIVDHPVGRLELEDGRLLVFMHGDDARAMAAAFSSEPAYLCHGHTHKRCDQRQEATRVINPGALFRAPEYTAATLDTQQDQVTFHRIK